MSLAKKGLQKSAGKRKIGQPVKKGAGENVVVKKVVLAKKLRGSPRQMPQKRPNVGCAPQEG